ncbi:MAG: dTDP-4-dehydrorhamnose reductase [Pirellulaceae bacterium]|nr:dTDP-4-dehydrorhamnose reductase [Pirellulaceae bacterium]
MKIAVIGARGMLGGDLCRVFERNAEKPDSKRTIVAWDIDEIDITDRESTIRSLADECPDVIVNAAAYVDLEGCEANPEIAWRVNAVGAQNLALAAERCNSELVYISSDYIFDGDTSTDYDETGVPNPLNHYGKSKLAGEQLSRDNCRRTYSLRTAWLFGHAEKNYVQRVLSAADQDGLVRMPADQIESPTYTLHLAEAIEQLLVTHAYGVYNVTSIGACTRYEFAKSVLQQAARHDPVELVDPKTIQRTTPRPARSVLDCRLFQLVTGHQLPTWQQGIQEYFSNQAQCK